MIIGVEELGISPKMNNLCRLVKEAKCDLLVINNGDVRLEKDYLRDVVAPFGDPKVGVTLARNLGWPARGQRYQENLDHS